MRIRINIICLVLVLMPSLGMIARNKKEHKYEPFDRGIESPNSLFLPKGTFGGGFTFSYNIYDARNADGKAGFALLSPFIKDIKGEYRAMSIAPTLAYTFMDNLSVGLRFDYSNTSLDLNNASINFNNDIELGIKDFGYKKQAYLGSVTLRNYMPIQQSKRFALFMEGRLTGGYAQSKNFKMEDGLKHGTYQDIYKGSVSLVPGICVFIANAVSFEVQIGVMGISYQMTKQVTNQVEVSQMSNSEANFNINLFSIAFGTNFYIMDKWHRVPNERKKKSL
jgi:hypothetical protein